MICISFTLNPFEGNWTEACTYIHVTANVLLKNVHVYRIMYTFPNKPGESELNI